MADYKFTHNWFAALTQKLWERYVIPRLGGRVKSYLEIGVAEAASLTWAADKLVSPDGLAVGIDPFLPSRGWKPEEGNKHLDLARHNLDMLYYGEARQHDPTSCDFWFRDNAKLLPDIELHHSMSASYMLGEHREFNVCYVDGNHEAPWALTDILNCWRVMPLGGILIVDDAERRYRGGMPAVVPALEAFEACFHGYFDILYKHPKQVAYVKVYKRRRGEYPPMLVTSPAIVPDGPTSEDG